MRKKFMALIFILPTLVWSQDYIDVFRLGLLHNFSAEFENTSSITTVNSIDIKAQTLTKRFGTDGFLIGGHFYYNKVQLFPNTQPADLYSTTLIFGWIEEFSDQLTAEFKLYPKVASDYGEFSSDDFYIGGSVLFKNHQSRRHHFKYGLYVSDEAFGLLTTPILGLYYLSDTNDFEADVQLPFSADLNVALPHFRLGFEYNAFNRSYRIYDNFNGDVYAEQKRMEFGAYLRLRTLSANTWAKAMIGYAFNSLSVYDTDDTISFYFIDFAGRDEREQLNPNLMSSLFFKVELIYRFPF